MGRRSPHAGAWRSRDRKTLLFATVGVLALLAASGAYRAWLSPEAARPIGGPFALVDGHGTMRTDTSFRGRFVLMFFGYTQCADVCPTTLAVVASVLDRIDPGARHIQPVFVTVDPTRDTPDRLLHYTRSFSPTLIGLTGSRTELGRVETSFHVIAHSGGEDDPQAIEHSAALYLIGPDGHLVATLPADIEGGDLETLLRRQLAREGAGLEHEGMRPARRDP